MAVPTSTHNLINDTLKDYKFGFKTETSSFYKAPAGLTKETIIQLSEMKKGTRMDAGIPP
mgnify:CR=1 FL=1